VPTPPRFLSPWTFSREIVHMAASKQDSQRAGHRALVLLVALAAAIGAVGCGGGGGPAGTPILNSGRPDNDPGIDFGRGGNGTVAVTYAVTGSAPAADISYTAADGSTLTLTAPLPWSLGIQATPGTELALSARSTAATGALTAAIRTATATLRELTTSAPFGQVTVSATCCDAPAQ
jgi:hypothetical protein